MQNNYERVLDTTEGLLLFIVLGVGLTLPMVCCQSVQDDDSADDWVQEDPEELDLEELALLDGEGAIPAPCGGVVDVADLSPACTVQWGDIEVVYYGTGYGATAGPEDGGPDIYVLEEGGHWTCPPVTVAQTCELVPVDIATTAPRVLVAGEVMVRDLNPGGPAPVRVLVNYCPPG